MKIEKDFLVEGSSDYTIDISRAKKYGVDSPKKDSGTLRNPDTVVIHYTANDNVNADIQTLYDSSTQASVHFVIDLDGKVNQLMPLNKIAWHAGRSRLGSRTEMNKYSIGIEIVNPGWLTEKSDGSLATWYNKTIKPEFAVKLKHKNEASERYWHTYTNDQINSVMELCMAIYDAFTINYIVGHDDIAPGRKLDPGPAFPLEKLQTYILDDRNESVHLDMAEKQFSTVKVNSLNIRQSGNKNAKKIAMPLSKGQLVKILDEKDGWYKVETTITGWVSSDYIE